MSTSNTFCQPRRAFTIVELLVVVAVLGILAALLFPVLARARANARRTSCASNLKQIGKALLQYAGDYDERSPAAFYGGNPLASDNGFNYKWMDAVHPYVKSEGVFACPEAPFRYQYHRALGPGLHQKFGGYVLNSVHEAPGDEATPPANVHLSRVADPVGTLWVADGEFSNAFGTFNSYGISSQTPAPNDFAVENGSTPRLRAVSASSYGNVVARHLETASVLWCDGHVKAVRVNALSARHPSTGALTRFTVEAD